MQAHFRILALLLLSLFSSQAIAATNDVAISLYTCWERLPSEQLMKMGAQYRNVTRQPDSALVCYSIVANRYYQGHQTRDDIGNAIEAMVHIAQLYQDDVYDYSKASSYNLQAKELTEKHHNYDFMPFILINEANIQSLHSAFIYDKTFDPIAIDLYKKAFYSSLQQKNWNALYDSFIDLSLKAIFNGQVSQIDKEMNIIKNVRTTELPIQFKYLRCMVDAVNAMRNEQPDSSEHYLYQLQQIAQEYKNSKQQAFCLISANTLLCVYYFATSQKDKALLALKASEKIATKERMLVPLIDSYENQVILYEDMKDAQMAEHYRILAQKSTIELLVNKKLAGTDGAKFLYELNKKNEEVREMAHREQMKSHVMWGALAFSLVLLIVLALLWLNYRRVQERNRQLYNKSLEMLRADEEKRELIEQLQRQSMPAKEVSPYAPSEAPQREGKLGEARQSDILHRVFMVMETSDEIFSPDFSLPRLAELVGDTRNNVSEAINLRYQGNFNALVNEYRIKEACRRFNDRAKYGQLTIEAVGQSVGFKSRSAFSTVFKQIVGLTPGAYQRQRKN